MNRNEEEILRKEILLAYDGIIERQMNILTTNKDLTLALNRLSTKCDKDVNSIIGDRNLKSYTDFRNELTVKFLEIPHVFKSTSESKRKEEEYRKKLLKKEKKFVAGLNINTKKIKDVYKDYINKAGEMFDRYLGPKEEAPYVVTDPAMTPKKTNNPWTWKYPPYWDEWGTNWTYSKICPEVLWASHNENRYSGQIGTQSRIHLFNRTDSASAYTNALSEVWVWYKMPAAGLVEAWLYLQSIDSFYNGCMDDLSGNSDINVKQQSWPYMWILYPQQGARFGNLLDFHIGEHDCCWGDKVAKANPGDFRFAHLFSTQSYVANQWVLIAFGIKDHNYTWTNDYEVDLSLTNRWFLHHLAIRSTGE